MASAARKLTYQPGYSVDGSLARDLDWELRESELRHAGELTRHREKVREETKVKTVTKVQVRERQKVSPLILAGFTAVIVLAVAVLMNYIQLMELSTETVELKNQLAVLETDNVTLTAQYEQMYDRATVKEAAEAAGMTKPSSSQIFYIDLSDGDNAVVYQQEEPSALSGIMTSLGHGIYSVVEYFN